MTLTIRTDRSLIRAEASSTRYVLVRYTAPAAAAARESRAPVNVALVLDRSGSMSGDRKFDLARQAVEQAMRQLRAEDRFSLVVYDDQVDVLARGAPATPEAKRRALAALAAVEPRGSTDLCSGWLRGCEQIAEHAGADALSRCLLLTDGLANHGITDRDELALHAGELRARGVTTSTFGVGADFDERLLRDMAHEGSGNFYFIEGAAQIPELLMSELGEALEVTVRQAALEITLPRGAQAEPLNRFRTRRARTGTVRIELGDLVSQQEMAIVVRVQLPRGQIGQSLEVRLAMTGATGALADEMGTVGFTFASHQDNDLQARDQEVDREVAKLYAARARAEATEANRGHDYTRAREVLERTAQRIRSYANGDRQMSAIASSLHDDLTVYGEVAMSPMALKSSFFLAEATGRDRDVQGRARRGL